MTRRRHFVSLALLPAVLLTGCDSWDHFQKPPNFSGPGSISEIPPPKTTAAAIAAADVPPLPPAMTGSLWRQGSKTFFRDQRARGVGDLLTVSVNLQESAEFANQTNLSRTTQNNGSVTGLGSLLGHVFPGLAAASPNVTTAGSDSTQGQGDIKRAETLVVNVAATVVQVFPNRNLEIVGSQEIRLNNELRQLQIRGVVRPEDILSDNTIASDKIAEARIAYGGRGVSSDLQRPPWGQDLINRVSPF
jgi:flagellar L-ring protein precursor FlgH